GGSGYNGRRGSGRGRERQRLAAGSRDRGRDGPCREDGAGARASAIREADSAVERERRTLMRMATRSVTVLLCLACISSCGGGPHVKKIARDWYVDDVEAGKPSPRLYWARDGQRVVIDREILGYVMSGCVIYETSRPSLSRVVFAVLPEKSPVPIVASDSISPWQLSWDGLRRFDIPKAQEDGRTILEMDFVAQSE